MTSLQDDEPDSAGRDRRACVAVAKSGLGVIREICRAEVVYQSDGRGMQGVWGLNGQKAVYVKRGDLAGKESRSGVGASI